MLMAALAAPLAAAAPGYPPDIAGVEYANVNGQSLQLDIYFPTAMPGPEPRPCIVYIHGGGWRGGGRDEAQFYNARELAFRGFVVVSISYRFSTVALWPAQLHDCKAAIRWIRANAATYNIDPDRIGVHGFSSGGQLSAMLGATGDDPELEGSVGGHLDQSSAVQAAAPAGSHLNFFTITGQSLNPSSSSSALMGAPLADIIANRANPLWSAFVQRAYSAGAVNFIDPSDPRFFIYHSVLDPLVPISQSVELYETCQANGVPAIMTTDPEAGHWIPYANSLQVYNFFVEELMNGGFQRGRVTIAHRSMAGGGGESAAGAVSLVGAVGQPAPGRVSGSDFTLNGGLFRGGAAPPPPPPCPPDVNGDRRVDAGDLAAMLGAWGPGSGASDVNGDGQTNAADLAVLLGAWGDCP